MKAYSFFDQIIMLQVLLLVVDHSDLALYKFGLIDGVAGYDKLCRLELK